MPVSGLSQCIVKSNRLKLEIADKRAARAATAGAIVGQAYSQMLTPVDTSFLINSQFRKLEKLGTMWRATVGYTAAYALAVHERSGIGKGLPRKNGNGNYWDPDAEPEFLVKGFELHKTEIDAAVKGELGT